VITEKLKKRDENKGIKWRGTDVSRIENLSDSVFAFIITLLVVSLEVPSSFDDLVKTMKGFVTFFLCFAYLLYIWHLHYTFFRRYGLTNTYVFIINSILLFVTLFYIYPLKFLANILLANIFPDANSAVLINVSDAATLMIIYSSGFLVLFICLALFYQHAYAKRHELNLNNKETMITLTSLIEILIICFISFCSLILALFGQASLSGMIYFFIGPAEGLIGWYMGRKISKIND
jgi:uncharacterized membrane protein